MKKRYYVVCLLVMALFLSGYATAEKGGHREVQPTEMSATTTAEQTEADTATTETVDLFDEVQFMTAPATDQTDAETETATEPATEPVPTTAAPTTVAPETEPEPAPTETDPPQTYGGFSDADINRIASVVNGEVGSMCGNITLTYSDGSQVSVSGDTIRMMHAMVVVNQYRSSMFPSTVSGCIRTYWSSAYDRPDFRSSAQWQACRQAVINALNGGVSFPSNVFGATQDASFGSRYPGYWKYARVDWNTGYCSGTYYYYAYG